MTEEAKPAMPALPLFSTSIPFDWFEFAERHFEAYNVTDHDVRYGLVAQSLSPLVRIQVGLVERGPPWRPEQGDTYKLLKARLLRKYGDCEHAVGVPLHPLSLSRAEWRARELAAERFRARVLGAFYHRRGR